MSSTSGIPGTAAGFAPTSLQYLDLHTARRDGRMFAIMKPTLLRAVFAAVCVAQDTPQDPEGCADSPLVARFPGSHLNSCDHKEFQAAEIPIGRASSPNALTIHNGPQ